VGTTGVKVRVLQRAKFPKTAAGGKKEAGNGRQLRCRTRPKQLVN